MLADSLYVHSLRKFNKALDTTCGGNAKYGFQDFRFIGIPEKIHNTYNM